MISQKSGTIYTLLKERLDGNRELLKHYDDIFQEQLQAGIMEEVYDEGEGGNVT